MKKAVVIIPTYNESENIGPTVAAVSEVFGHINNWDMKVLVVDDSSPDGTGQVVQELQNKYPWLELLTNPKKSGLGGAYLKAMAHAFGPLNADVVFEFDADLQHDPTKIPEFLAKIDNGADMVLGSRYMRGGGIPSTWGLHRKFLSIFGNLFIRALFLTPHISDWTSGYRAITRKVYDVAHLGLQSERFTGYAFQIGFLYKSFRAGFKIEMVPYQFADRTVGTSKMSSEYAKNTLIFICKIRLLEILGSRKFKFLAVGGVGAMVQLISLSLLRQLLFFELAFFLAIEVAVVSNFLLNNTWTFADRKLDISTWPAKFLQFNLSSAGSILIQTVVGVVGKNTIGLLTLFTLPIINLAIDTGHVYAVVGILVGMIWNYYAYTKFVWKKVKS